MGMMINRRRVMGGNKLPYDAEIEFLCSSGTQYIDTGVSLNNSISLKAETLFTVLSTGGDPVYFGSLYDNFCCGQTNGYLGPAYKNGTGQSCVTNSALLIKHKLILENGKVTVDDDIFEIQRLTSFYNSKNLYLFCGSYSGGAFGKSLVAFDYFKLWDNDEIVLDFIPVRIGNVGYMYDKLSKQLFGNSGTGDFILGADKGTKNININVKTHSTGSSNASLDVITDGGEPVNIVFNSYKWSNGYIAINFNNINWRIFATTPCLYDGQVYNSGEVIVTWDYRETKDINIVANI